MLAFDDIQHILLTRAPALTGRYEFLSFRDPAGGRAWLAGILDKVQSAAAMQASVDANRRWVTVAFTFNGLRALGVDEASLATFPDEFRQGMVARAQILGDEGKNHPDHWVGGLASPDLHAVVMLFARDAADRERSRAEHEKLVARCEGVTRAVDARPGGDPAVRVRARPLRVPRPAVAAGHRGLGPGAHARFRRATEGGRIHPRATRTKSVRLCVNRSPSSCRATAASWRIGGWRSTSARSAIF